MGEGMSDTVVYDEGGIDIDGRLIMLKKGPVTVYLKADGTKGVRAPADLQYLELAQRMGSLLGKDLDEAFPLLTRTRFYIKDVEQP
jgi:hypothetical protein